MAVTLRYFTEFGIPVFQPRSNNCAWLNLCTSLLYFVVRVRCHCKESLRSLTHLLMSFLIITVTLFAWKCCYVKKTTTEYFCTTCCKKKRNLERFIYAWNVAYRLLHYINIVYSKVLQALSIILTNQCDMSKQVITIWSKQ